MEIRAISAKKRLYANRAIWPPECRYERGASGMPRRFCNSLVFITN